MQKKVTIIIPTFSRAKYIKRAINSILNQTYKNFEIIVVDDNNSDSKERQNMEIIMSQFKDNKSIKYLKHDVNKNGSAARNTGIKNASGEYITFLDDDDMFMPDRLQKCVDLLENNPKYGAIYTSVVIIKNGKIYDCISANKSGNFMKETLLRKPIIGTGSNMFFRKDVISEIGLFDESFIRHQDLEYLVRFFKKYELLNLDEYLVIKDESDRSNVVDVKKSIVCREHFLNKFKNEINYLSINNDIMFLNYVSLAMLSLYNRDYNNFNSMRLCANKYQRSGIKVFFKYFVGFITGYINLLSIRSFFSRLKLKSTIKTDVRNDIKKVINNI